jgi:hypothetical protein
MKEEAPDIRTLLSKLGSSAPALECRLGSQITHFCINPSCIAPALFCSNEDCGCCSDKHTDCPSIQFTKFSKLLSKQTKHYSDFVGKIFEKEDELIEKLS